MVEARDLYKKRLGELNALVGLVKKLMGEGNTAAALEILIQFDESAAIENQLLILKNRLKRNENDNQMGVVSRPDYLLEQNQIASSLLKIAEGLLTLSDSPLEVEHYKINIREEASLEKVIGSHSKLLEIRWLQKAFVVSKSVGRITVQKRDVNNTWKEYGTGFLVQGNYLFTNHHVLSSPAEVATAIVEFNYIEGQAVSRYQLDPTSWIGSNADRLDFARVQVLENNEVPLSDWGYLEIDAVVQINPSDPLPIIQHPEGGEMKIALDPGSVLRRDGPYLFYKTDTLGGSSGSPVFNKDWKVIALHQAGITTEAANRGILFSAILEYLSEHHPTPIPIAATASSEIKQVIPDKQTTPPARAVAKRIFWMYDEDAAEQARNLRKFFYILERDGAITSFDMHRDIGTGVREDVIRENLHYADLVICLVNPMFMISCLLFAEEAVERKTPIVPVLLEDAPMYGTVLGRFYSLPTKYKNVAAWVTNGSNLSAAYMDIYIKIKAYLDTLTT